MALLTRAYAKGKINNYKGALKDINSLSKSKFKNCVFVSSYKKSEFYPDRLRLSFYEDMLIFDESKNLMTLDSIKSKIYVKLLISPQYVWKNNNSIGILWTILQIKIYSKSRGELDILYESATTKKSSILNEPLSINPGQLLTLPGDDSFLPMELSEGNVKFEFAFVSESEKIIKGYNFYAIQPNPKRIDSDSETSDELIKR
mgnify:CR=1 FL=1